MDGVYTVSGKITIQPFVIIRAVEGARPIITASSPPDVLLGEFAEIHGVWFGGIKPNVGPGDNMIISNWIDAHQGSKLYDCVLYGYINGITRCDGENVFQRCKFINCGLGHFNHPIYIAHGLGTRISQCIFIACDGFSMHYYDTPSLGEAVNNFTGRCYCPLAFVGSNHFADKNIFWNNQQYGLWFTSSGQVNRSVWSGALPNVQLVDGQSMTGNHYVGQDWQEVDIVTNFGASSAQIDAWIDAIEAVFTGTAQQIHDANINFSGIAAMLATWQVIE